MDCSPPRLLHPWGSPGKSSGVGCHALPQGIFLTQHSQINFFLSPIASLQTHKTLCSIKRQRIYCKGKNQPRRESWQPSLKIPMVLPRPPTSVVLTPSWVPRCEVQPGRSSFLTRAGLGLWQAGPCLLNTLVPLQVAFCPLDAPESSLLANQEIGRAHV